MALATAVVGLDFIPKAEEEEMDGVLDLWPGLLSEAFPGETPFTIPLSFGIASFGGCNRIEETTRARAAAVGAGDGDEAAEVSVKPENACLFGDAGRELVSLGARIDGEVSNIL